MGKHGQARYTEGESSGFTFIKEDIEKRISPPVAKMRQYGLVDLQVIGCYPIINIFKYFMSVFVLYPVLAKSLR